VKKSDIFLSAVVVAHNEEYHLDECLKSLAFADELVVVLDKCTDKSKKIAQLHTKNIIEGSWDLEGARRNVALDHCQGEWILELDADERITSELQNEILEKTKLYPSSNFKAPIDNYVGERFVKYGWQRSIAVKERQFLHGNGNKKYLEDRSLHPIAELKGDIIELHNPILHYMDHDLSDLIQRFNRYTTLTAKDLIKSNSTLKKRALAPCFLSFSNRFFKSFILGRGYKEGCLGLYICLLGSSFKLASYLKAKELQKAFKNKLYNAPRNPKK